MKISSWNVNSVRARLPNIISYLKYSKPDILMVQEIKTENKNFPFNDFKNLGYESHVFGQKSYNGVAFITKVKINKIDFSFIKDKRAQSRIIVGEVINNSKDEISKAVKEMLKVYKNKKIYNSNLHNKFWGSFKDQKAVSIIRNKINLNISDSFLKKNRNLI